MRTTTDSSLPLYLQAVRGAKRARRDPEDDVEAEEASKTETTECPPDMEAADFNRLKELVTKHRADPMLSLLPMPKAAYEALNVPAPKVATVMETAWNCLFKPNLHEYSTTEVEVRDLTKTHTAADFPAFYEGPSHPHMRPEGGVAVIAHPLPADAASSSSSSAGAGVGAGAGAAMLTDE
jgi:hypothetical protein